ncbi:MAG: hypothetical protein ACXVPU_00760 [Bacteroidia bacterium]
MKKFILKFSALASVFFLLLFGLTSSSCNKDKTCHGKVTVSDSVGTVIPSANVHLAAPSVGGDITYDGVTDGSGNVNFEVKLPAIFDVTATKGTLHGTGVLRLDEAGKSNSITVKMN